MAALRGIDGGFTAESIQKRLPQILDSVLKNNPGFRHETVADLQSLRAEITDDAVIKNCLTNDAWRGYTGPFTEACSTWMTAPWFFVENYFYKRILQVTAAREGESLDPFQSQKDEALSSCKTAVEATVVPLLLVDSSPAQGLYDWLLRSLWGNKGDLSRSGGSVSLSDLDNHVGSDEHILRNDAPDAVALLLDDRAAGNCVAVILDNSGLEAVCDVCLIDYILQHTTVCRILVMVKDEPVFVSDVMEKDFFATLAYLDGVCDETKAVARRVRTALDDGRVLLINHPFFTSPTPFPDMPADLRTLFASCKLAISKGDANYRRLLSDCHWPHHTKPVDALSYFSCPVLALRTCKSELIIGVPSAVVDKAASMEPSSWCTSGNFAVLMLSTLE